MIMRSLAWYYVTRLALVALWLGVATVGGLPLWASVLAAVGMIAYFVWLPHSGRYVVHEDEPLSPMRRDERMEAISGRAARWAFAVETLLAGAGMVWGTLSHRQEITAVLGSVLVGGTLTYLVAQGWLTRRS